MKTLVIVESPSKAKTISKFLDKKKYSVTASMGHVRDLPKSKIGIDTEGDFSPAYVVPKEKTKTITELKKLMKGVDAVVIATDEDREGEAIGWHLLEALKIKEKEYERIVFHEITEGAIKDALKHPRKLNMDLVMAQQSRRILDRLVGYSLSPLLWSKIKKGLSAGRVQSVAVRLIVDREREILAFVPEEYWNIYVDLVHKDSVFRAELTHIDGKDPKLTSQAEVDVVWPRIKDAKDFTVSDIQKKQLKRTPPAPFTTSSLQQEASRKHGFSVKQTMMIAQQLYEGIDLGTKERQGLITYMRTDSVTLSETALNAMRGYIPTTYGKEYLTETPRTYKTKSKGAQEAHEAIRPVQIDLTPDSVKEFLDERQLKLYTLIWKRALATQMTEAVFDQTTVKLHPKEDDKQVWKASGQVLVFPGYYTLYKEVDTDEEETEDPLLPKLAVHDHCERKELIPKQSFTKPPARFTEASLVKKLEDEGIGRPSTYAPTISTVVDRGYVEKKEKHLHPTELGIVVNDFLVEHFPDILNVAFTATMEESLDHVALGEKEWVTMLREFWKPFSETVETKKTTVEKVTEMTDIPCDLCGKMMMIRFSRAGRFLSCSGYPECKGAKPLPEEAARLKELAEEYKDEKCPQCESPMVVKRGRFGEFLACTKYPECKGTKQMAKKTGAMCSQCIDEGRTDKEQGMIIMKKTKKGRIFYGCNKYPVCTFTSWKKP